MDRFLCSFEISVCVSKITLWLTVRLFWQHIPPMSYLTSCRRKERSYEVFRSCFFLVYIRCIPNMLCAHGMPWCYDATWHHDIIKHMCLEGALQRHCLHWQSASGGWTCPCGESFPCLPGSIRQGKGNKPLLAVISQWGRGELSGCGMALHPASLGAVSQRGRMSLRSPSGWSLTI